MTDPYPILSSFMMFFLININILLNFISFISVTRIKTQQLRMIPPWFPGCHPRRVAKLQVRGLGSALPMVAMGCHGVLLVAVGPRGDEFIPC